MARKELEKALSQESSFFQDPEDYQQLENLRYGILAGSIAPKLVPLPGGLPPIPSRPIPPPMSGGGWWILGGIVAVTALKWLEAKLAPNPLADPYRQFSPNPHQALQVEKIPDTISGVYASAVPPKAAEKEPDASSKEQRSSETDRLKNLFGAFGSEVNVPAGAVLMRKGEAAEAVFLIEKGTLVVHLPEGKQVELGPGKIVGEIGGEQVRGIRTATVTAKTDVVLLRMTDSQYRGLVTSRSKGRVREMAERRLEEFPSVVVGGQTVRLINIDPPFESLVREILEDPQARRILLQTAGIDLTDPRLSVVLEDLQYGGEGTIKYVVRLGLRVDGRPVSLGIRFYTTRLFRTASDTHKSAFEEVEAFRSFAAHDTAISIFGYHPAATLLGPDNVSFTAAGVAGLSVGEFVVVRNPIHGIEDTGIAAEHMAALVETMMFEWLMSYDTHPDRPGTGRMIGDPKPQNFVLVETIDGSGPVVKHIDLGYVGWTDIHGFEAFVTDFVDTVLADLPAETRQGIVQEGFRKGRERFTRLGGNVKF